MKQVFLFIDVQSPRDFVANAEQQLRKVQQQNELILPNLVTRALGLCVGSVRWDSARHGE